MLAGLQLDVVDAGQSQEVGAPALEELEIARMVDHAGEVGIGEIDPRDQPVPGRRQLARERSVGIPGSRHHSS